MNPWTRSTAEIDAETAALIALKPIGPWASNTARLINVAIQVLAGEFAPLTSADFKAITPEMSKIASSTHNWLTGSTEERPSAGWGELVEHPTTSTPTSTQHP